jgi:hypothetical protein
LRYSVRACCRIGLIGTASPVRERLERKAFAATLCAQSLLPQSRRCGALSIWLPLAAERSSGPR